MARYLITGAGGFTGLHMAAELLSQGHEVHGAVRDDHAAVVAGLFTTHVCDLKDREQVRQLVESARPDKVVHLAGIAHVAHSDVTEIYETNLLASRNLLEALARLETPPSAILLASSANIYGNRHGGMITEDNPPDPANDYAVSKIAMEHMARLFGDRLPIIIVRPFNYTGAGQASNFLVPKIIDHLKRRAPAIELGNIDVERDWSDVRDVVTAYRRLLDCAKAVGETFNICSGHATSLKEVFALACSLAGYEMEIRVNPAFVRTSEVASLCGSSEKLEQVIGPLSRTDLEQTLAWMLEKA
ncbi:nucleoside-diphosphate-sugar epimerase [Sphingobium xanthum]|jgi:nucleoside-diphosphate-sugar epimerase|uniref:GDP-mannose 4,6-dehydratase n=1 Tax=Sphingobium xanthum TaxID=1387165 RepID=UPI001C8B47B5|nr:GDP-mannose 4,6-dehydratase [Sphingobium xanthum]